MLYLVYDLRWLLVAALLLGLVFGFAAQRWGR
jgi:hypothetical protein